MVKLGAASNGKSLGPKSLDDWLLRYNSIDFEEKCALLEDSSTPDDLIARALTSRHSGLRAAALRNKHCSVEALTDAANDRNSWIRAAAATNPNTPRAVRDVLRADREWHVREAILGNPDVSLADCAALAGDPDESVLLKLISCVVATPEIIDQLATSGPRLAVAVMNPHASQDLLQRADAEYSSLRALIVRHAHCPVPILESRADDEEVWVRVGVASNSSTPDRLLATLALDSSEEVRSAVFKNEAASDETKAMAMLLGFDAESGGK